MYALYVIFVCHPQYVMYVMGLAPCLHPFSVQLGLKSCLEERKEKKRKEKKHRGTCCTLYTSITLLFTLHVYYFKLDLSTSEFFRTSLSNTCRTWVSEASWSWSTRFTCTAHPKRHVTSKSMSYDIRVLQHVICEATHVES